MSETTVRSRIAIIGGGAAGLSAASRLASRADVVIYEARAVAGGLLRTEEVAVGTRVDAAVQLVSGSYTGLFALAREAGAADVLVRSSGRDALWRKGSAQEITYGNVASMATSGALPTMLKLKLGAKYVPYLTLHASMLDANDPAHTGGDRFDGESIAAWGRREMGDDFVEYLAYPLLAAYYGSVPERTSAAMYHALARVGMDVRVYAARGGMAALAQAIASSLESRGVTVHMNARVTAVRRAPGSAEAARTKWLVAREAAADETFDAVIIATPPHVAAAMVDAECDGTSALAGWLRDAAVTPAPTIGLAISGALRTPYFGLSFPRGSAPGDRIVALTVQHHKPGLQMLPGSSGLTVFPSPSEAPRVASMTNEEALAFVRPALERVYPGIAKRITACVIFHDMHYRGLDVGMMRRMRALDEVVLPEGLALAGDYTMAPTVEGAVRSGERAAARVVNRRAL
jgi:oxygen-dependent protoporphyrinogen oxidase